MELNQLKTFADACAVLSIDPENVLPDFSRYPERHVRSMIAHAKLVIIVEAANMIANDGAPWVVDFGDSNQIKYEAWFYKARGSSGFRFDDYDSWGSGSTVGSRLCFLSREVAEYVAETFEELYNEYL